MTDRRWVRTVGTAVLRDQWLTNRPALTAISSCWLVLAIGQATLAIAIVRLVATAGHGVVAVAGWAALGGLAAAAVSHALFLAYMLRIELSDRAGHVLSCELLSAVGEQVGTGHLEDQTSLDTIRIASDSWALVGFFAGAIQLSAISAGLIATMPVVGSGSWLGLLTIPLCAPLLLASARAHRIRSAATRAAASDLRSAERLYSALIDPDAQIGVRVNQVHGVLVDRYRSLYLRSLDVQQRGNVSASAGLLVAWLFFLSGFGVLLYGIIAVTHTPAAGIVPIVTVALQLQGMAVATVNGTADVARGSDVGTAYTLITGGPGSRQDGGLPPPIALEDGITLTDVSFRYPETTQLALHEVTVRLPAGSLVAVVGAHGSGKSTLVKLLSRMYEPTSGAITVDGHRLAELSASAWRSRLTACFQDFARPFTSMYTAIAMGDIGGATPERIAYAAERSGVDAITRTLPDGLHTQLGDRGTGTGLSGGQWQRLALARAFMRPAPLLITLDEPSASFDPVAELEVFRQTVQHVHDLARDHGTIALIVAHRYSTVRDADLILVMHKGRLAEAGTHLDLVARNGRYATIYRLQQSAHDLRDAPPLPPIPQEEPI